MEDKQISLFDEIAPRAQQEILAKQLAELMVTDSSYNHIMSKLAESFYMVAESAESKISKNEIDKMLKEILPRDILVNNSSNIYKKLFNQKQLDDMIYFYKTDSGAILRENLMTIHEESEKALTGIFNEKIPALVEMITGESEE